MSRESEETRKAMQHLGDKVKSSLPEGWGFALLVFETGKEDHAVNYISSADRQDMVTVLQTGVNQISRSTH